MTEVQIKGVILNRWGQMVVIALSTNGRGRCPEKVFGLLSVLLFDFTFTVKSRNLSVGNVFFALSPHFCSSDIINVWWLSLILIFS